MPSAKQRHCSFGIKADLIESPGSLQLYYLVVVPAVMQKMKAIGIFWFSPNKQMHFLSENLRKIMLREVELKYGHAISHIAKNTTL